MLRIKYSAFLFVSVLFTIHQVAAADIYTNPGNSLKLLSEACSIYVFGDSHCLAFEGIRGCRPVHMGAVTMHRIGRDGTLFLDIRKHGVKDRDTVIFNFGEIDVRCHIKKQCELQQRTPNDLIEFLSIKFIQVILQNRAFFDELRCVVCSVTPPTDAHLALDYPFYGSLKERVDISKILNAKLEELCEEHGIFFLDVYDEYADSQGALNTLLSDGTVHISRNCSAAISEKLFELLAR